MTASQRLAEAIEDMQRSSAEYAVKLMDVQYGTRMDAMNATIRSLETEVKEVKDILLNGHAKATT